MSGLYIHIPFCASRCIYCGFYSTTADILRDRYVDALCREMTLRKNYLPINDRKLSTIYIGGGTPSQLSTTNLEKISYNIDSLYPDSDIEEFTMECNPDDVTPELAETINRLHINRISMGAQTFSDSRLNFLHRRHSSDEVRLAIDILRDAGIDNISIDLMFGFPDETLEEWISDIKQAIALNVEHISAYSLMYEENTPLYQMLKQGKVNEIDDNLSLKMYNTLIDCLTAARYEHYEISNFAQHGYRSRHNNSYWQAIPYIGIGAAAHSYDISSRQWNVSDIYKYIESIEQGVIPMEREILDEDTKYNDLITTTLRTCDGIDLSEMRPIYRQYLIENASQYMYRNQMEIKDNKLRFTRDGLYISDAIMTDLMKV